MPSSLGVLGRAVKVSFLGRGMNLFVEICPEKFVKHVAKFVAVSL
jgi:hypothetical protein